MTYRFQRKISNRTAEIITPSGRSIRLPYTGDVPQTNTIVHPTFNKCCCPIGLSFDKNQKPQFNDVRPRRTKRKRIKPPIGLGETMFLIDVSGSYGEQSKLVVEDLKSLYSTFKNSTIATFVDKPMSPFGAGTKFGQVPDWVYRVEITNKMTKKEYLAALNNFSFGDGMSVLECQFEALLNAVITLGRQYKYVLVLTDGRSHLPGDNGEAPPHDHKTIVGPQYDGTQLDYPNPLTVLNMAKKVSMIPIFNVEWYLPYVEQAKWGYVREVPLNVEGLIEAGTTKYKPQGYGLYKK